MAPQEGRGPRRQRRGPWRPSRCERRGPLLAVHASQSHRTPSLQAEFCHELARCCAAPHRCRDARVLRRSESRPTRGSSSLDRRPRRIVTRVGLAESRGALARHGWARQGAAAGLERACSPPRAQAAMPRESSPMRRRPAAHRSALQPLGSAWGSLGKRFRTPAVRLGTPGTHTHRQCVGNLLRAAIHWSLRPRAAPPLRRIGALPKYCA